MVERILDEVRAWAQDTKLPDGRRVVDQEWVQMNLARVHAKLEFVKLINWKVAAPVGPTRPTPAPPRSSPPSSTRRPTAS